MFWSVLAWVFMASGTALALLSGGGEVSLWLIAFGWVLEVTLGLLVRLGARKLVEWKKIEAKHRLLRLAGLSLVVISAVFRAQGRVQLFSILSVIATAIWALALVGINSNRRKKYG